jgi:hypothetical protein
VRTDGRTVLLLFGVLQSAFRVLQKSNFNTHYTLLAESQCKPSYLFGYTYYTGTIPSQPPTFHHDVPTIAEHHHLLGIYPTTSTMYARIHITSKYSNTPSIHPSRRHSTTDPTSHHRKEDCRTQSHCRITSQRSTSRSNAIDQSVFCRLQ